MNGLKNANVNINRKMLAEIAVSDEKAFAALVEKAKATPNMTIVNNKIAKIRFEFIKCFFIFSHLFHYNLF